MTAADRTVLIVMGVAGSGKSTVARLLAERLGWTFAEGDEFHSPENRAKMADGVALTDEDRWPWLGSIRDWLDTQPGNVVLTCSALRRAYRDALRAARPRVRFVHLDGSATTIGARLRFRSGHFMPQSLLGSQFAALEPLEADEDGVVVSVVGTPADIVDQALAALGTGAKP